MRRQFLGESPAHLRESSLGLFCFFRTNLLLISASTDKSLVLEEMCAVSPAMLARFCMTPSGTESFFFTNRLAVILLERAELLPSSLPTLPTSILGEVDDFCRFRRCELRN